MVDFVEIARGLGITDELFLLYLQKKVAKALDEQSWYSVTDLYVTLLDRHRRTYQAWEKESNFPVRKPHRNESGLRGRVYSPSQVVQVLWWWWNHRAVERRGRGGDTDAVGGP